MTYLRKNILIIGSLPPPFHGSTLYLKNLLDSKIRDHFVVIHLNTSDPRDDLDNLGKLDWQNISLGIKNCFQAIYLCIKHRPQIVYLCSSETLAYLRDGLFILIASIFSRAKIVQHMHLASFDKFYERSNWLLKKFIGITQKQVDCTLVLGETLRSPYFRWHQPESVTVVPNGIDLEINLNGKFEAEKPLPQLYYLGNLLKFKGIHTVVEAVGIVKQTYPGIQLQVAGKWSDDPVFGEKQADIRREVEAIVAKYNMQDNVHFLGPTYDEDKTSLLKTSEIFIYPSVYDAFPLVILEAMAAGNVTIAIDKVGAIPDVIKDGENGILVREQDPKQIADAIVYLIENPEIRHQMGRKAFSDYQEKYTFNTHIQNMTNILNEIVRDKT